MNELWDYKYYTSVCQYYYYFVEFELKLAVEIEEMGLEEYGENLELSPRGTE